MNDEIKKLQAQIDMLKENLEKLENDNVVFVTLLKKYIDERVELFMRALRGIKIERNGPDAEKKNPIFDVDNF